MIATLKSLCEAYSNNQRYITYFLVTYTLQKKDDNSQCFILLSKHSMSLAYQNFSLKMFSKPVQQVLMGFFCSLHSYFIFVFVPHSPTMRDFRKYFNKRINLQQINIHSLLTHPTFYFGLKNVKQAQYKVQNFLLNFKTISINLNMNERLWVKCTSPRKKTQTSYK